LGNGMSVVGQVFEQMPHTGDDLRPRSIPCGDLILPDEVCVLIRHRLCHLQQLANM
jgi:hypothetical protein